MSIHAKSMDEWKFCVIQNLNGKVLGPLVYQTRCIVIDPNKISKSMRKRAREFLDEIFFTR